MKKTILLAAAVSSLLLAFAGSAGADAISMRVEGEWCVKSNLTATTNANYAGIPVVSDSSYSSGMALYANGPYSLADDEIYFTYEIDVPSDGYYDMQFKGTLPDSSSTSNYRIQINNDEKFAPNSSSGSKISGDNTIGVFETRVYLEQGANSVSFIVNSKPMLSFKQVSFGLDYFELTYSEHQGPWAEAERYEDIALGVTLGPLEGLSGKYATVFNKRVAEGTPHETVMVYAAEDGVYSVETVSTINGAVDGAVGENAYIGDWSITNEEGGSVAVAPATVASFAHVGDVFYKYTLKDTLYLHKGINRLMLNFMPTSNGSGVGYNSYIDYIAFEKAADNTAGAASKITIEGESVPEPGYWAIEGDHITLSQGMTSDPNKTNWSGVIIGDEFRLDFPFVAEAEADYNMFGYMTCANGTQMMFSQMEFKLDDDEWTEFDVKNYSFVDFYNGHTDMAYQSAIYKYRLPLHLEEGEHILSVRVREKRTNHYTTDWYYDQIDKFELVPEQEISAVSAQISSPVMKKNTSTNIFVSAFDEAGQKMEDVDLEAEYFAADSGIAEVGGDGTITAINPGKTTITVIGTDSASGKTFRSNIDVEVVSDDAGIRLLDAKISGGKLLITLSDIGSNLDEIELAACVGAQKNGVDTSYSRIISKKVKLKNPGVVSAEDLHGIMPTVVSLELGDLEAGEKVTLLVWDSSDNMIPILKNTEVAK